MLTIKDPLLSPYHVEIEENQYIIYKTALNKLGRETSTVQGYYTHFPAALQRIARLQLVSDELAGTELRLDEFMHQYVERLRSFAAVLAPFNT